MQQSRTAESQYKRLFLIVLLAVVLSFCVVVGSVVAWLQETQTGGTGDDMITIGVIDFEIYNGSTKMTTRKNEISGLTSFTTNEFVIPANASSEIRNSLNLTIRNTGTIDALVRATLEIYYKDESGNKHNLYIVTTTPSNNQISLDNTGWVNDLKDNAAVGYTYYNAKVKPYVQKSLKVTVNADGTTTESLESVEKSENAIKVFSGIRVPSDKKSVNYYATLTVDGIAYAGNIYQEVADKTANKEYDIPTEGQYGTSYVFPFGVPEGLPSGWTAWKSPT